MKTKIITCHDVYNVGASLQAYALQHYLINLGHDVEIIDYKPDYLSKHYNIKVVSNPHFDRPIIRNLYLAMKLPGRLKALKSERKKNFDRFRSEKLKLTSKRYHSNEELITELPDADLFICGSDQIWNPLFQNGKDAAFFLDFVPKNKKKVSYAASFAVESISELDKIRMRQWLCKLDAISVREKSGLSILESMGLKGSCVCDPVLLLTREKWDNIIEPFDSEKYLFVYDFDHSPFVVEVVRKIAKERNLKIYSFFESPIADKVLKDVGPQEFLGVIKNAEVVLSNSFHATVFSVIYHTDFYVIERKEAINTRMKDFLTLLGLEECLISKETLKQLNSEINWKNVDEQLIPVIEESKEYLRKISSST